MAPRYSAENTLLLASRRKVLRKAGWSDFHGKLLKKKKKKKKKKKGFQSGGVIFNVRLIFKGAALIREYLGLQRGHRNPKCLLLFRDLLAQVQTSHSDPGFLAEGRAGFRGTSGLCEQNYLKDGQSGKRKGQMQETTSGTVTALKAQCWKKKKLTLERSTAEIEQADMLVKETLADVKIKRKEPGRERDDEKRYVSHIQTKTETLE